LWILIWYIRNIRFLKLGGWSSIFGNTADAFASISKSPVECRTRNESPGWWCAILRYLHDERWTLCGSVSHRFQKMIDIRGAIEPQFYTELLKGLGLNNVPDRDDRSNWGALRELFTKKFLERSQSEWEAVFDGTDSCVTPVIPLTPEDNRLIARLSDSPGLDVGDPKLEMSKSGTGTKEVMSEWMGWTLGKDYTVDNHGTVNIASFARL
jgi:hypothetical protein